MKSVLITFDQAYYEHGRPAFRESRLAKYVLGHHHGSRRSQSRSIAGYAA